MKWMWSTALVVVAVSAALNAQSKGMTEPKMADQKMTDHKMADGMSMTYTGCVEAQNGGMSFLLTHVGGDQAMMHHDAMMKSGSEMAEKDGSGASNDMHGDRMMPSTFVLAGRTDLKKHVGQKVTVGGTVSHGMADAMPNGPATLTVTSLKVAAKSCS